MCWRQRSELEICIARNGTFAVLSLEAVIK